MILLKALKACEIPKVCNRSCKSNGFFQTEPDILAIDELELMLLKSRHMARRTRPLETLLELMEPIWSGMLETLWRIKVQGSWNSIILNRKPILKIFFFNLKLIKCISHSFVLEIESLKLKEWLIQVEWLNSSLINLQTPRNNLWSYSIWAN